MSFEMLSICLAGIILVAHTVLGISVASTPAPYKEASPSNDYASPTTAEPATPDYSKYNNQHYPYSRQVYDPSYNPANNPLVDTFTPSSSLLSPRPFLFHRLPSFFGSPAHSNPVSPDPTPAFPYNSPSYPAQSGFVPSLPLPPTYDPQYAFPSYPNKYPKSGYTPSSCDYQQLSPFRNPKPLIFYPAKPENFYDYLPSRPSEPLYRYQPAIPPYSGYANNIYH